MVTVLFADLVDSTGLAQRLDAERAREILGYFFEAASEELLALRGRAEKFIGDAVMAVFGLPTVHEDDALRAVRAGLAIRARTRRLSESLGLTTPLDVHVGIESGEAATGLGPAGQLLVTGPVVNAAARLQTAAAPGEVLAGETTVALTTNAVSYGDQRQATAKGFDGDTIAGFAVQTLTPRSARRTIPFVGRSSELAILRESLHRATSTGHPVLVSVLGEPGIGKSRLADELTAIVEDEVPVLVGRARPFTDTATFSPAATIVAELAGLEEDDPDEKAKRRLRELAERYAEPGDAKHLVERLSLLFGMSDRKTQASFVQDVQAGFVALVDGLARDKPAVLVFEDAHELRPPMLELIERLGSPARGRPSQGPGPRARAHDAARTAARLGHDDRERRPAPARAALRRRVDRPRATGLGPAHRGRRGGRDRRARRRQPLLHHRDDRHAPPRRRRRFVRTAPGPPAHGAGRRRGPARPPRTATARAHPPRVLVLRLVRPGRAPDDRPRRHRGRAPPARGGRDPRARGPGPRRHALARPARDGEGGRVRDPAQARAGTPARADRRPAVRDDAPDVGRGSPRARRDRLARPRPGRPHGGRPRRRRAPGRGRPRAAPDGEPDGDRVLREDPRARRSRGSVGRPRGASARRHRRGPVLARRVSGGHRRARPGGGARPQVRRPVHALARAAVPGRHRDQRRGRPRQGRDAARRVARRGGGDGRAVGVHPHAPVRRLGAVDARGPRRGREDLAPRARGRRPRRRVGARAGAQLALDQPNRRPVALGAQPRRSSSGRRSR